MSRAIRLVRGLTLLGAALVAMKLCGIALAGQRLEYPRPQPTCCVPNTAGFGYFQTTWRQWPGEDRQAQDNSRAIGAKVLPTPEGQEEVPLPKAVVPPAGPGVQGPPQPPEGVTPPSDGGILPPKSGVLPPSGGILPPEGFKIPGTPVTPAEPKTENAPKSLIEGSLPGLPVEPDQSPLPLPFDVEKPTTPPSRKDSGEILPPSSPQDKPKAEEMPQSPPTEQPKPKDTPKPNDKANSLPTNKKPLSDAWSSQGTVVALAGNVQPEDYTLPGGFNRADPIATAAPHGSTVQPAAYAMAESSVPGEAVAIDIPPVALGGYCPVELTRNCRWVRGDVRFTVVHKGYIYRLSGPVQRRQFLANPDALSPVNSGQDPVLAVEEHRMVTGGVAYCATYNGRLYMFSGEATQAKFNLSPQRYAVK